MRVKRVCSVAAAAILMVFVGGLTTSATAQGVRYNLEGAANRVRWDENLGLSDADLLGGRFGIDFGRLVGLQGYWMQGSSLKTQLSTLSLRDNSSAPLGDQDYDLTAWGADLVLKVGNGRVAPYLKAGGGVLVFEPMDGRKIERILGKLGGGLEYQIASGLRADFFAENTRFRLDRFALAPGGRSGGDYPEDPNGDELWSNFSLGVGLGLQIGGSGSSPGDERWSFASIPIEPFGGRLDFKNEGLGRRNVGGIRAGIDVGNYVGLRGFYWRGVNDDLNDTELFRGYGGEAQFNLTSGIGPAPYLVIGAGRLDFMEGFLDAGSAIRSDEEFLILGGGVGLRLTDNFRLNFAARDHIIAQVEPEDVSNPDQLQHNWMYSAGLTFNLGRGRSQRDPAPGPVPTPRIGGGAVGVAGAGAGTVAAGTPGGVTATTGATRVRTDSTGVVEITMEPGVQGGGAVAMIPVPERGEIYIRYGEPGGMGVMGPAAQGPPPAGGQPAGGQLSQAQINQLLNGMSDRVREIMRTELERMNIEGRVEDAVRGVPPQAGRAPAPAAGPGETSSAGEPSDRGFRTPAIYGGFGVSDPASLVLGGRVETGRLSGFNALAIVPEFSLGFADGGKSFMLAGNLEYQFAERRLGGGTAFAPTVRGGLGVLSVPGDGTQGVLNFTYGFSAQLGGSRARWFAEHQGIDLFARNRLVAGLRWGL